MPANLLQIRFLQFKREWHTLGLLHKLLFSLLFLTVVTISYQQFQKTPNCWFIIGLLWLAAGFVQLFRPDKGFVFLHLVKPQLAVFLEYAVTSLPLILPAMFTSNWYCALIFLFGLFPVTFIRTTFSAQTRFVFLGKFLPATAFEWISGLRKNLLLLVPVYGLALAFSWVKILPLALLWLFFGMLLGTYQVSEPLPMLRAIVQQPRELLRKKILETGKILVVLSLPVIGSQTIFHPWLGLAGLAFLLLQFCVFAFAILLKYSTYEPNKTLNSNMLLLAFAQLSVVLPFFLLLPLVLVFRPYNKAKQTLNYYLPPC